MDELKIGSESSVSSAQYIVIRIGSEQYGINISVIDNIIRMVNITRCPKVAPYIKGVINLRGSIVPVMSLRAKMGLPEEEYTKATRIIILKLENVGTLGIVVDEVKEVITLEADMVEKVSNDTSADKTTFVQSVGKCGAELVSLLDLNAVAAE